MTDDSAEVKSGVATPPPRPAMPRWLLGVFLLLVAAGVMVRFAHVRGSLLGRHSFRQTQTAFTAYSFQQDGINVMHSPVPVFGPPWDIPFEMPLFQACVVGVARITGAELDVACRLTNILFFCLSLGAFFLLGWGLFNPRTASLGLLLYLWSPFTIYWSVSGLMEFMAVFLALTYAAAFIWWIRNPRRYWLVGVSVLAGVAGALVKITTMASVAPLILAGYFALWRNHRRDSKSVEGSAIPAWVIHCLVLSVIIIPLICGQAWVWHGDAIKAASPLTRWLTSENLTQWNYGTISQRLALANWGIIGERLVEFVAPLGVAAAAVYALFRAGINGRERLFAGAVFAGLLLPISLFFNLYVIHDYYLCAVSPMLPMLAGLGLERFFTPRFDGRSIAATGIMILSLLFSSPYAYGLDGPNPSSDPRGIVAGAIQSVTPPDQYVIVDFDTWDPTVLYYAKRKGLMLYTPTGLAKGVYSQEDQIAMIRKMGLRKTTTVVTYDLKSPFLALWHSVTPVRKLGNLRIVKVSDPVGE